MTAGWARPPRGRTRHYYPAGQTQPACGKHLPLPDGTARSDDHVLYGDCVGCDVRLAWRPAVVAS